MFDVLDKPVDSHMRSVIANGEKIIGVGADEVVVTASELSDVVQKVMQIKITPQQLSCGVSFCLRWFSIWIAKGVEYHPGASLNFVNLVSSLLLHGIKPFKHRLTDASSIIQTKIIPVIIIYPP